jgi:hypothetical protein
MPDATAVSKAWTNLYDALRADTFLNAWRVHRVPPRQIAPPTIYIDNVEMNEDDVNGGGTFVVCTFSVVLVHDGAVRAQVEALADMLAHVWDAASTVGRPTSSRPANLDVGGLTLRSHLVRVEVPVMAHTMCPSTLVTAEVS